jgi:hypothetical protein
MFQREALLPEGCLAAESPLSIAGAAKNIAHRSTRRARSPGTLSGIDDY